MVAKEEEPRVLANPSCRSAPIKINAFAAFLVTVPSGQVEAPSSPGAALHHQQDLLEPSPPPRVVLFLVRYSARVILSSAREARRWLLLASHSLRRCSPWIILLLVVLLGS